MNLKERYPYLAAWKRYGWDKKKRHWKADFLPGKPLPPADKEEVEKELAGTQAFLEEMGASIAHIEEAITNLRESPTASVRKLWRERIIPQALTTHFQILKIQDSLEKRTLSRRDASKRLADMFLPSAQGGKFLPSNERRRILRAAYNEMLGCLKEIRQRCEIRVSRREDGYNPLGVTPDDILDYWVKDALDIFTKDELTYIVDEIPPRDACLKIIKKRIRYFKLETLRSYLFGKD